jgi:hypothetical protein
MEPFSVLKKLYPIIASWDREQGQEDGDKPKPFSMEKSLFRMVVVYAKCQALYTLPLSIPEWKSLTLNTIPDI